ncbi:ThuA domain-containing protein [uncultured Parabacteroides sp.]|uniref:ThuA domain-containing protein n=1 Tax=uncultured Parabacteroides sp. TaxID=512312 RepID=UPI0028043891|nr:ThuA domain-containing protein [uncultured Parabacteroides sp.]
MRHLHFGKLLFVVFSLLFACTVSARKPIKTLLITGQNNHNWQVSHNVLKQILENSCRFEVDFAVSPEQGKDMSGFVLDFSPYQLVVLDYNGDSWPEETNRRFLEYVQNGGGVVIYHAADNAFSKWPEFNKICALGGWEGRNENSGPYVYWQDGKLVKDSSAGPGGSHGRQHEYVLNGRDKVHPIVKGLPLKWRHAKDELYDRMRGPGNIRDILYTAYSDKETNGSGREEPLIFTVDYGNARIFHTMLGHAGATPEDNIAMQCTGFQVLLLRGAEWAATGKVTQKVPKDFPTETACSYRKEYKEN